MKKGVFITGTDTGVGKTIISGAIVSFLKAKGIDVGVMKPAESGCVLQDGKLIPHDALFLKEVSEVEDPLDLINPFRLKNPLAPWVACELEGIRIDKERIKNAYLSLSERHEIMIVEGIGGLLVPVNQKFLVSDLIGFLDLPIVVVSRSNLGTINHTLLTIRCAENLGIKILGVIINNLTLPSGLAERTNPQVIKRLIEPPLLGETPFLPSLAQNPRDKNLLLTLANHINLSAIL